MQHEKKPLTLRTVFNKTSLGTTTAMVACTLASGAAHAQENAKKTTLPTVVVEASEREGSANPYADPDAAYKVDRSASGKFTEKLVDTPKSVTVIPKEVIKEGGATSFKDVMRTQPGITLGTGEGGNAFGDRFFIRGFDARNDVYIDGVRDAGVNSRETFATEQIEILKGPSSGFAGRGTTGGAINIISKAPTDTNFNEAEVTFGTDMTKRTTLDTNYVVSDKLAVRVNGMLQDAGVAGRDKVEQNRFGGAIAADYQATDAVKLGIDYYHLTTEEIPDWGVPFDVRTQRPFEGAPRDTFYGLVNRDFLDTQTDVTTAKLEAELTDSVTLNSKVRYGVNSNAYVVSAPERPNLTDPNPANWTMVSSPKNRNADMEYITNQTDVTFRFQTGDIGHTMVTGFEIGHEEIENNPFAGLDSETGLFTSLSGVTQSIFNPNPLQPWTTPIVPGDGVRTSEIETRALYVLDTVKLNNQWEVLGGLRFDNYDVSYRETGTDRTGAPINTNLSQTDNLVNGHVGVTYKPLPNGSIYVAYGTSSNPVGEFVDATGNTYGGLTPQSVNLDPERNRLYEIGTKWELFNGDLALTSALFKIEKENARVISGAGAAQVVTLDGEQEVRGIEFNAAGRITPQWQVFGGLTVLDTEITKSPNPADVGKEFPNVADFSFSLLNTYQLTDDLKVGGLAYYSSEKHGGRTSAGSATLPAYWRFDAMAEYDVVENVDLRFNVLNITDERYYDATYASGTPFSYIAPGRAGYVTLAVQF